MIENAFLRVLGKLFPGKFPPGKFPPIKLPSIKFLPGKFSSRKFATGLFPSMSLIIFIHLTPTSINGGRVYMYTSSLDKKL